MSAETDGSRVQRAILAALRDPAAVAAQSPVELDFTIRVMRRARLLGRLAFQLREAGLLDELPQVAIDALTGALVNCEARARAALWELDRIAWAMRDLPEVPLVALKGSAYLLAGLPNAGGRLFADVDLLVPESGLAEVEARLKARGWVGKELTAYDENYYRLWTHELPPLVHAEREMEVDLHHNILMRTARLKPDAARLFEDSLPVPGSRFRVLAPVDMALHAMTHLFHGGEIDDALRELVDIDDLLRHFGASEPGFWQQFWPRAVALDLTRPAFYGLRYAGWLLATPMPRAVSDASSAGGPAAPVLAAMDRFVPRALEPRDPDRPTGGGWLGRLLLYMRAHWARMPPLQLSRHLAVKIYVKHLQPASKVPRR